MKIKIWIAKDNFEPKQLKNCSTNDVWKYVNKKLDN